MEAQVSHICIVYKIYKKEMGGWGRPWLPESGFK